MGVAQPFIYEVAPDTYAINEFGLCTMYLAVGEERALLIDTGCGVCNLPEAVKSITDKPYMVALTHGHADHFGGIGWYDRIYLHKNDMDAVRAFNRDEIMGLVDSFGKMGSYKLYDYSPEDVKPCEKMPEMLPIEDGEVIDLGGRSLQAYLISGHTPGGLIFIDDKNRIVFSGDCINFNLLAMYCSVEETQEGVEKFISLSDRFDQNFNGHAGPMGSLLNLSQPKSVPQDLLTICRMIRNGDGKAEPFDFLGFQLTKMKYGKAGISYDPSWINRADR